MTAATEAQLLYALQSICPARAYVGTRFIAPDDHLNLGPGEAAALSGAVARVRNASGAARDVAKSLLRTLGAGVAEIPRAPQGFPLWPKGFLGSLSHSETVAAAIVARDDAFECLGIDVEEQEQLEPELARFIVHEEEKWAIDAGKVSIREVFSIKEAVFKALFPRDRVMLDFQDVLLDFNKGNATARYGATVKWRCINSETVFSIAWRPGI